MGNIELKLNISRVDLIIACSVVVIAVILVVGFIIWLVKSSRQNRALKSIDKKLAYGKSVLTAEEENDICNRTSEQNESLKKEIERRDESEQCRKIVRDVIRDINMMRLQFLLKNIEISIKYTAIVIAMKCTMIFERIKAMLNS